MDKVEIYLNGKQIKFASSEARIKVFVGGRGAGKSTINGVEAFLNAQSMPRSKGFFLGLTYVQILTKFLPPVFNMWATLGLVEHTDKTVGHYVVCRKPPNNWPQPIAPPKYYNNIITLCNGTCIELISFDRKNLNRGGSYDWGIIDEAALIPRERFMKEIRPSVRGNIYKFTSHRHHSLVFTTSMPWTSEGEWILDMEQEMKERPKDVLYMEATALDNVAVLGSRYIEDMKRDLPFVIFEVEVMNRRLNRLPNGFYNNFNEERHCYVPGFIYSDTEEHNIKYTESDYNPDLPLEISFDFGAKFTCAVVAQELGRELKFISLFYDKRDMDRPIEEGEEDIISSVVRKFVSHYVGRHRSHINLWGDRNGNNKQANSTLTFFEQIMQQMRKKGMSVTLCAPRGLDPLHEQKHLLINKFLAEDERQLPKIRINRERCKALIISIQQAGITPNFKKDKSSEGKGGPQEQATHLSDAFDCLVFHKYRSLTEGGGNRTKPEFI